MPRYPRRGPEIRIAGLLAEQLVGVLREPGEILVDTLPGLGEVCGRVIDGDGQMAKFSGQPSGLDGRRAPLPGSECFRCPRAARPGTRRRRKLTASCSVNGEISMPSATTYAWPVQLP